MVENTEVDTKMTREVDKELTNGLMVESMMGLGKTGNSMVKACTPTRKVWKRRVFLKKVRDLNGSPQKKKK